MSPAVSPPQSLADGEHTNRAEQAGPDRNEPPFEQRVPAKDHADHRQHPVLQRLLAVQERDEPLPLMLDDLRPMHVDALIHKDREHLHQPCNTQQKGDQEDRRHHPAATRSLGPQQAEDGGELG